MTGVQMAAEMMRFYEDRLLKAQAQDAVQDRDHLSYKPDFIGDYGDWGGTDMSGSTKVLQRSLPAVKFLRKCLGEQTIQSIRQALRRA